MKRSFALIMVLASLFILSIVFVMLNDTLATTQRMTQMFVIYPEVQEAWNAGRVWCNYVLLTDTQNVSKSEIAIDGNTGIRISDIAMPGLTHTVIPAKSPYTATRFDYATGFIYASVYKTTATGLKDQPYIEEYECHVNYFPQKESKLDYAATINFIRYLNIDPLSTYISVFPEGIHFNVPSHVNWKWEP